MIINKKPFAAFLLVFLVACSNSHAQVSWKFSTLKRSSGSVEIHMTAQIDPGWHIYSSDTSRSVTPTTFSFLPALPFGEPIRQVGRLVRPAAAPDEYYIESVDFIAVMKADSAVHGVKGTISFVACTEEQCMPAQKEFSVVW